MTVLLDLVRDDQAGLVRDVSLPLQVVCDGASLGQTSFRDASRKVPIGNTGLVGAAVVAGSV